jgi:putative Mg2+ transporter-C (MgtC) family protein
MAYWQVVGIFNLDKLHLTSFFREAAIMEAAPLFDIAPLDWAGIGSALLCGAIIGIERQLAGKPAGLRTSILICLGTYLFVATGVLLASSATDPTRIIGQVVTGIGFLGAGVILAREGVVLGVTSAAVIWVLAAIGSLIGIKRYSPGIIISLITVLVLVGMNYLESSHAIFQRGVHKQKAFVRKSKQASEKK